MSTLIECDRCGQRMYADSRSQKDAFFRLNIDSGYYHLCKKCHKKFFTEFMKIYTEKQYDEEFGDAEV